jgi:hypothetical protein
MLSDDNLHLMSKLMELLMPSPSALWAVQVYTPESALVTLWRTRLWCQCHNTFVSLSLTIWTDKLECFSRLAYSCLGARPGAY